MNRSESSISTRVNTISRSPECNKSVKRSISGNLTTRASVPAARTSIPATTSNVPPGQDFAVRNFRVSFEKENEGDRSVSNPLKPKSSAVLKGGKGFMAPTISASSKVTASPKKKVLADRNELPRSSVTFSDAGSSPASFHSSEASDMDAAQMTWEQGSCALPQASKLLISGNEELGTSVSFSEGEPPSCSTDRLMAEMENEKSSNPKWVSDPPDCSRFKTALNSVQSCVPDCVNRVETHFTDTGRKDEIPGRSSSSPAALLVHPDNGNSLPPYDPETNFLSPRPRFLHYKPKEKQIRIDLSTEGTGMEEIFTSEGSLDTDQTDATPKSSDSVSCEEEDDGERIICSSALQNCNSSVKRSSLRSLKLIIAILIIGAACLSRAPTDMGPRPSQFHATTIVEIYASRAEALHNITDGLQQLLMKSVASLSKALLLAKEVFSINLTASYSEEFISDEDYDREFNSAEKDDMKDLDSPLKREEYQGFAEAEAPQTADASNQSGPDLGNKENVLMRPDEIEGNWASDALKGSIQVEGGFMVREIDSKTEAEDDSQAAKGPLTVGLSSGEKLKMDGTSELKEGGGQEVNGVSVAETKNPSYEDIEYEVIEESCSTHSDSLPRINIAHTDGERTSPRLFNQYFDPYLPLVNKNNVIKILTSCLAIVIMCIFSVQYLKPSRRSNAGMRTTMKQSASSENVLTPLIKRTKMTPDEAEMVEESGPSDISSTVPRSLSYRQRMLDRYSEEIQSGERNLRRNSTISECSTDSASFGSYTSYERVHAKQVLKGCNEADNALTPVRRSSRIRTKIISS